LLIYGFGYTGELFCRRLLAAGHDVQAVVRSSEARQRAESVGARAIDVADLNGIDRAASTTNALLVVAPPSEGRCPGLDALFEVLSRREAPLHWVGYLSSTAVYGDQGGAWTYETSALNGTSTTGLNRISAERGWSALCERTKSPLVVFRLSGIYGPGRSALDKIRDGRARRIVKHNHVLSRIHVEDIVSLLEASLRPKNLHSVYNVSDDEPSSTADVVAYAAGLLGTEPPFLESFEAAELAPAAARYFQESRRISNSLAKSALGWRPRFPSYREGLNAIHAAAR
jgi:nucleoside-diphosphate-sugar epimerase